MPLLKKTVGERLKDLTMYSDSKALFIVEVILIVFIVVSLAFIVTGCAKFNPNIMVGDYMEEQLIGEDSQVIKCSDPAFNKWGCMHEDDWVELKNVLDKYKVPYGGGKKAKRAKRKLKKKINKVLKSMR